MKKFYALFIILFFSNHLLFAKNRDKGTLSGKVTDNKTGKPIEGVSITITDVKLGTSTNEEGLFNISNIVEGKHLVEISHLGYSTIAEYIFINGETRKDFSLVQSIIENNAVVVFGINKAAKLKKLPFQVSIMNKEELLQSSSTNLIESITKKPGISSISSGPAVSKPIIRGLGYNRVLTINDGVRQEGQQWGDEHGIEIDESSVSKIEVLKGPASLIYGSDAMAGVINIISSVPIQANLLKINAGSNLQSNNHLRSLNGNIAANKNGVSFNIYGSIKEAADYKNKYDGHVFNSNFNEHNFGGYIGYNGTWGFAHFMLSRFNLITGLVEGERDSLGFFVKNIPGIGLTRANQNDFNSVNPTTPFQHIIHFKVASDNNFNIGKNRLNLNIGWQQNQRQEFSNPENLNERALFFDLKTLTYTSQFIFMEKNGWKNSIGINGMSQKNTNLGIEQIIPNYLLFDIGGNIFTQKEFKKLTISGGVRLDNRVLNASSLMDSSFTKGEAFKKQFSNFSGSIGLTFPLHKTLDLKANIARAFRAPSIPELASNGAHEGTNRYEYGDIYLKSEISTQADISLEWNKEHFSLNLAGYYNHFSNFIYYRKLQSLNGNDSVVQSNGQSYLAFKFDQQKVNMAGFEFSLDVHPHPLDWLHFENTFSYVRGLFTSAIEGTKNLSFVPAPQLITQIKADRKKIGKVFKNGYALLEIQNTFSQNNIFTAYHTETITPGYCLVNAGFGAEILSKKNIQLLGIYFSANNITDVAYQNHLSRLKYTAENLATGRMGVFNMGRNFSLKINVPLSFKI